MRVSCTNGICSVVSALHLLSHKIYNRDNRHDIYIVIAKATNCRWHKNTTSRGQGKPYPIRKPGSGQDVAVSPDRTEHVKK